MKNKLIISLIAVFVISPTAIAFNSDLHIQNMQCSKMLHNKYMDICYNNAYKSAVGVEYEITKKNMYKPKLKRDKVKFHADKRIPNKYRSSPYSYQRSGF